MARIHLRHVDVIGSNVVGGLHIGFAIYIHNKYIIGCSLKHC